MSASPIEVVGQWLQNLLDPGVVNSVVAPDATYVSLNTEDAELKEEIKTRVEKRSGVDERVAESEATLAASERLFSELTTALADLTADGRTLFTAGPAGVLGARDHVDPRGRR